jgi:uncharacterized protein YfiM (DUF2279 family)
MSSREFNRKQNLAMTGGRLQADLTPRVTQAESCVVLLVALCLGQSPLGEVPDSALRAPRPLCIDRIVPATREPDRWFGMDKFWHFSASFVSVGAGYHLCENRVNMDSPWPTALSLGGTLGLGLSKEFLDLRGPSRHFSWKDLVADLAGIGLGYLAFVHKF